MGEIIAAAAVGQASGTGTITCDVVTHAVGTWDAQAGDSLVAVHAVEWGTAGETVPDLGTDPGWELLDGFDHSGGPTADGLHVKLWALESWDGTTTAFVFDHDAAADATLTIVAVRDVDLAGAVAAGAYTATGTATRTAPSVAGETDGVLLGGATIGDDVTAWSSDDMAELADVRPSVFISSVVGGEVLAATGATGGRDFTATGAGSGADAIAWTLAFPPAVAPTDPPGAPSVGTADFGADAGVAPPAPGSAGARQYAVVTFTVSTETWVAGQGPADSGWTLRAALSLTTPNSNVPDRGNTARVEVWEQGTPSTAAAAWTKSGTRRYSAFRVSWPGVGATPTFATPVQSSNTDTHVTPASTPPANVASKVIALAVVDQGPTPVTLTAPGSPWSSVFSQDMPTPQISETQSVRLVEQTLAADPSPDPVTATFTTSAVEEAFLLSWVLPGAESAGPGTVEGTALVQLGPLTVTAQGVVETPAPGIVTGAGLVQLGPLTVAGAGLRVVQGAGAVQLGPLAVTAQGVRIDQVGVPFLTRYLGAGASLLVEVAFGADLTDTTGASWTWTDVTVHVRQSPGISAKLGRADEASTSQPARCTMVLDNTSGDYSLGGASRWWPYVRRNTPVRVRVDPGDGGGRRVLFQGWADGFTPSWDSLDGKIPVVSLSASGTLRRLEQGSSPTPSALRRALETTSTVVAYWPFEEGKNATYAPALRGGTDATFTGTADWQSSDTFDSSAALPALKDARFDATVYPYPNTGAQQVRFLLQAPADSPDMVLVHVHTTGSIGRFDLVKGPNGELALYIYRRDGTQHSFSGDISFGINGDPLRVSVEIEQDGPDIAWNMGTVEAPPLPGVARNFSGTITGETCGVVSHLQVNPQGQMGDAVFGHLTVENTRSSLFEAQQQLWAYRGETPTGDGRFQRLGAENGLTITIYGVDAGADPVGEYDQMGPQLPIPLLDLLRECETCDQGQLWDGRDAGLSYTTRRRREQGAVVLTIDAAAGELAGEFAPTHDDQRTRNRVAATRLQGVTVTYEDQDGPLGTAAVGIYDSSLTVNNYHDQMALQYAAWLVHLGTVEGYRVPALTLDMRETPHHAAAVLDDLIPGARVDLVGADDVLAAFPPGPVQLIVEGIEHTISAADGWRVTLRCSPFAPWGVGRLAAETGDTGEFVIRLDTAGSVTAAAAAAGATTLLVTTTSGPSWTTRADDYPLTLDVGGVPVVATSCAGTGPAQTFTVQPLTHPRAAGSPVRLADPHPLGL